jgi:topoisomerase IA-like protein
LKKGPYGFYISYDGKNYQCNDENTSFEKAVSIILGATSTSNSSSNSSSNSVSNSTSNSVSNISPIIIKEFGKYLVKNGKYGPYVQYEKKIAKIPKNIVLGDITKDICKELIQKAKSEDKDVKKKKQYFASYNKKNNEDDD